MDIRIEKKAKSFEFEAFNEKDQLRMIANEALSGPEAIGFRPMELLLAGLGGCMSIDILNILQKQRQEVKQYKCSVKGQREERPPNEFRDLHLHIEIEGDVEEDKLEKAIALAKERYCSVYHSLDPDLNFRIEYELSHG